MEWEGTGQSLFVIVFVFVPLSKRDIKLGHTLIYGIG